MGRGRPGGDIELSAGNGGPGGRGGSITAVVGKKGRDGTNPTAAVPVGTIIALAGGNGGDSADSNTNGGRAGAATISAPDSDGVDVEFISISEAFNGGKGFNGCNSTPRTRGTNGGSGGTVTTNRVRIQIGGNPQLFQSLNGGRGGDGNPPGTGGERGNYDAVIFGSRGADGDECPPEEVGMIFDALRHRPINNGDSRIENRRSGGSQSRVNTSLPLFALSRTLQQGTTQIRQTVSGPTNVQGINEPVFALTNMIGSQTTDILYVTSDATNGMREFGSDSPTLAGPDRSRFSPPIRTPHGLQVGQTFTQPITQTFTPATGQVQTFSGRRDATLVGFETVTVPAGTFTNCARLRDDFFTSSGQSVGTQTRWFALDVGIVRAIDPLNMVFELVSATVGGRTIPSRTLPSRTLPSRTLQNTIPPMAGARTLPSRTLMQPRR